MGSIEEWARKWLENQRHKGKTCLEIKTRGSKNYVYHSTSRYDKEIKRGRKVSKYLGKLDKERGFIPKGQNKHEHKYIAGPRNITEYGNSMLLHRMMQDIKPLLKEGFPGHWEEICALAMVRASGNVPLKRAKDAWAKLYNADDTKPNLNPKNLSRVLREVGVNRAGQNVLFRELADMSKQLVYDLSSTFPRSMSINQAEKGYNKDKIHVPQINLALLCSADTGLPAMIRSLPGSVKDIKTLHESSRNLAKVNSGERRYAGCRKDLAGGLCMETACWGLVRKERKKKRKWHSLIDKVWNWRNLNEAWEKVKQNRGAGGIDDVTIDEFERNLEQNLNEIQRLLKQDRYKPNPVKRVYIPKPGGKQRPLGIPTIRDRVVQQALKNVIEPIFEVEFLDSSFGYRPGKSAKQAISATKRGCQEI